jgi:DNA-binding beta-propeller fold protein YncE
VQYTANEVANAKKIIKEVTDKLKNQQVIENKILKIDTRTGTVTAYQNVAAKPVKAAISPVPMTVLAENYTTSVKQIGENLYRMDIHCDRPADGAVEIIFDTAEKGLFYSAGAGEEVAVEIPTDLKHDPAFSLSNGFIYLNNGYSLVKDCSVEHLAATWKMKEKKLVFRQELNEENPGMNMRFYFVKGTVNDGLQLGNQLNTWPSFTVKTENGKVVLEKLMPEYLN